MLNEPNNFLFVLRNYGRKIATILIFGSGNNLLSTSNTVKIKGSMLVLLRETIMEDNKQVVLNQLNQGIIYIQ